MTDLNRRNDPWMYFASRRGQVSAVDDKGSAMGGKEVILWSVRIGLGCYAVACYRFLQRESVDLGQHENSSAIRRDRLWWSAAGLIFWIHFAAAFHFHHHWSHQHAFTHTAQRTGDMLGWEFGYGVYFNYLFLLLWVVDVSWWWFSPAGYLQRRRGISLSIQLFFLFVIINGAIVFVRGPTRWVSILLLCLLGILSSRRLLGKTEVPAAP